MATKFLFTVVPNICATSIWDYLKSLFWRLKFWDNVYIFYSRDHQHFGITSVDFFPDLSVIVFLVCQYFFFIVESNLVSVLAVACVAGCLNSKFCWKVSEQLYTNSIYIFPSHSWRMFVELILKAESTKMKFLYSWREHTKIKMCISFWLFYVGVWNCQ